MTVSGFLRGWHNLTRTIWPQTTREQTQDEIARLDGELSRLTARLVRLRLRINDLRERADGDKAARLETLYQRQIERLDRRKRLRQQLASGRMVVVDVTYAEES